MPAAGLLNIFTVPPWLVDVPSICHVVAADDVLSPGHGQRLGGRRIDRNSYGGGVETTPRLSLTV